MENATATGTQANELVVRPLADRCPGALTLHEAVDGLLARVRLPGGFVTGTVLASLGRLAVEFGDGRLELTSRGNVQLRAIRPENQAELAAELANLGLLPSPTHERVRNVIASPLAGLSDDRPDVTGVDLTGGDLTGVDLTGVDLTGVDLTAVVAAVDAAICATPELRELSGRFLFAVDDGSGDVGELRPDITAQAQDSDRWLVTPGRFVVGTSEVPATVTSLALAFLNERQAQASTAWRISDLIDGELRVPARLTDRLTDRVRHQTRPAPAPRTRPHPSGVVVQPLGTDGLQRCAVVVIVPLGRLTSGQARVVSTLISARPARITPWRTIVIPDVSNPDRVLAIIRDVGLDCGKDSIWNKVSACAGRPGCSKALADVQSDATTAVRRHTKNQAAYLSGDINADLPVHWSGCSRRCGHPSSRYVDVLAGVGGYTVTEGEPGLDNLPDNRPHTEQPNKQQVNQRAMNI